MLTVYSSSTIIVNKEGMIIDYSSLTEHLFSEKILLGQNISKVLASCKIKNPTILLNKCGNMDIYIIKLEKEMNAFLEYVLEKSYDEIFITDGNGITLYCNQAFEKHYNIKREQILGKDAKLLETMGLVDRVMVHEVIKTKNTITYCQHTSQEKTIMITLKPIFNKVGEVIYVIENCRDISQTTQLENILKQKDLKIKNYQTKLKYFATLDSKNFLQFTSSSMKDLNLKIQKFAMRDINILLLGETGTGKTYLANHIHDISLRKERTFVTINCSTLPENLIESELFGHEKGSFTDAFQKKEGLVEQADGGTLFLDEIGELSLSTQGKLLQLIQEKTYTPIGSIYPKKVDIRIIAATNKNLEKLIKTKKFRNDLYFRLALGVIEIPALRNRQEDINNLIDYFLNLFNKKYDMSVELSKSVKEIFLNYSWPGNIRELEHVLEFLVINASTPNERISEYSLPINMVQDNNSNNDISKWQWDGVLPKNGLIEQLEEVERKIIEDSYSKYKSSYKIAQILNISQSTAHRLINKYIKSNK